MMCEAGPESNLATATVTPRVYPTDRKYIQVYPTDCKSDIPETYDLARAETPWITGSLVFEPYHNGPKVSVVGFESGRG